MRHGWRKKQGRTYDLSNGAQLTVTFTGDLLTLNKQEYDAMKQLLDALDLLRVPIKAKPESSSTEETSIAPQ